MAEERQVTITIVGKNLTDADFQKAIRGLGGVRTEAEKTGRDSAKGLGTFDKAVADLGKKITGTFSPTGIASKALLGFGATIAATFTVGAIVSAIKNTGEWAGRITDLSKKMGLSVEAVQRLDFAAKQNGSSVEAVSSAIAQMSKRLVEGDTSAVGALNRLNLSLDQMRAQAPDRAFATLATAISAVPDPMERSALAMQLFGKSGADLLPVMGNLEHDMGKATVVSKSMIEAGDRLGDSWSKLLDVGKGLLAGVIVPLEPAFTKAADAAARFAQAQFDAAEAQRRLQDEFKRGVGDRNTPVPIQLDRIMQQMQMERMVAGITAPMVEDPITGKRRPARTFLPGMASPFDPLGGQSGSFIEGQLTKAVTEKIKKATDDTAKEAKRLADVIGMMQEQFRSLMGVVGDLIPQIGALPRALAMENALGPIPFGFNPAAGLSQVVPGGPLPDWMQRENMGLFARPQGGGGGFSQFLGANLGPTIMSALTGGGNVVKSIGGLFGGGIGSALSGGVGKILSGTLGATIGGALGSVIPGIGNILGSLGGSLIGTLFGPSEKSKTQKARGSWITDMFGDEGELRRLAEEANVSLDKLFSTKKVKDFESEATRVSKALKTFADDQAADTARLDAAVQKYGFSFEQLGPAFRQQKLHEQASELINDWRVLIGAGFEVDTVNKQMADSINDYVKHARAAGAEVPEALRPILQKMIDQKLLVDENGDAFRDIESVGLHFSRTVTESIDRLIDKIGDLIDRMNDVPDVTVRVNYEEGEFPQPPGGGDGADGGGGADQVHVGGRILPFRAHRGFYLGPNEVPIIGQTGEYMVSRRGVDAVGVDFLDRINTGRMPVTTSQNVFVFLDANGIARRGSEADLSAAQARAVIRAVQAAANTAQFSMPGRMIRER